MSISSISRTYASISVRRNLGFWRQTCWLPYVLADINRVTFDHLTKP